MTDFTNDCGHQCFVIGGPWIAEDPMCPEHGVAAQKAERHAEEAAEALARRTPAEKLAEVLGRVEAARVEANELLTEMLKAAVLEIAAKYPGHEVSGLAAQGSWFIQVDDVHFDENMEHEVPNGPGSRHIMYGADNHYDRAHPVFEAFDDVWDQLKTYPVVRFVVDKGVTTQTDW